MDWIRVTDGLAEACIAIGKERIKRGTTQRDLADNMQIQQGVLSRIETANFGQAISANTYSDIRRLANVMGVALPSPVPGKKVIARRTKHSRKARTAEPVAVQPAPESASAPAPESLPLDIGPAESEPSADALTRRILESVAAGKVAPGAAVVALGVLRSVGQS